MIEILQNNWSNLLSGFGVTVMISIISLCASLVLGTVFAIMEVVPNKTVQIIAHSYIELFRNIPLLVITMIFYLIVPQYLFKISGFTAGCIGLSLYTSAFIAECIRAGINSVGEGQMEGARSNGMTYVQAMRFVILPQAFKVAIPSLGNQFINLIKNSSVLAFVAGFDLMYQGDVIAFSSFQTVNTYLVVGCCYLVLTLPLSYYMRYLEKKIA
ncbi:amino acid ABC transporter permease [Lactobacillus jensenii]|jgi:amino ABC transporter, permease protein, 3-TM region, his/glu/gln/arg/opine family|uniref:Amino acid ABC transporter permease n=1 Tax=Lactobacillus jensenii TaxID=109790 RepID=A0A5N1IJJ8_LACJE|nr:amino acid ABC transporter permease [Lactobacillus jensenii]EEQ69142.1 ABC transporter, permease protein [Lactobacillus jensenii 1153]ERJ44993.1 glutamine ABC transporter permease [Lactobacillus jensenii MD IIE-70(2)]APT14389.1 glutamine ABC transporter permease [Lactobacillus jensenii]EEQ25061.1 ABC transporter, permease protein [Lactobacillus jensenii 269-3]EEX28104.1 putative glutamine ABC transporter permease protein GlnM [Lactobacillus jensenii SJ-7A-US]